MIRNTINDGPSQKGSKNPGREGFLGCISLDSGIGVLLQDSSKPTKQILAAILPCMEMSQNKAQMSKGKISSRKKNWELEIKRKTAWWWNRTASLIPVLGVVLICKPIYSKFFEFSKSFFLRWFLNLQITI